VALLILAQKCGATQGHALLGFLTVLPSEIYWLDGENMLIIQLDVLALAELINLAD
jgi:hypothetical protein